MRRCWGSASPCRRCPTCTLAPIRRRLPDPVSCVWDRQRWSTSPRVWAGAVAAVAAAIPSGRSPSCISIFASGSDSSGQITSLKLALSTRHYNWLYGSHLTQYDLPEVPLPGVHGACARARRGALSTGGPSAEHGWRFSHSPPPCHRHGAATDIRDWRPLVQRGRAVPPAVRSPFPGSRDARAVQVPRDADARPRGVCGLRGRGGDHGHQEKGVAPHRGGAHPAAAAGYHAALSRSPGSVRGTTADLAKACAAPRRAGDRVPDRRPQQIWHAAVHGKPAFTPYSGSTAALPGREACSGRAGVISRSR